MLLLNDISKYQTVNWDTYKNNTNGVILKASEGNGYTDPKFTQYQSEVRRVGLPLGFYHFARPDLKNTPEAEAAWFLKVCGELKDGEFLCLDYEATWTGAVVDWCLKFLEYVKTVTGVNCFIYLNQALIKKYNWASIVAENYPLWVAAYTFDPNNNSFVTGAWPNAAMQQWSNKQVVPGITGGVDANVFFGDAISLKKYGYKVPPVVVPEEHYTVVYKSQILAQYEKNPIDTISEVTKQLSSVKETLAQEIQNNATLQSALSMQEADNSQLTTDKRSAQTERDTAISNLKETQGLAHDLLGMVDLSATEFRKVSTSLSDLQDMVKKLSVVTSKYTVVMKLTSKLFVGKLK